MSARWVAASTLIAAAFWAEAAFALPALDGRTVRLEDQKGKALLLFFWATW